MHSPGRGQINERDKNKDEISDRYDHKCDKNDDDDDNYFFLDIENETEIPLASSTTRNEEPALFCEEFASSNRNDTKISTRNDSIRRCHSVSGLKLSLSDDALSIREKAASLTGEQNSNTGLRRIQSYSILKTSDTYNNTPQISIKRTTSFSTLEIREYPITLGDNPGGAQGPPISLDWEHNKKQTKVIPLEMYEELRPPRRTRHEMHMAHNLRRWRLIREKGYTLKDLEEASRAAEAVRKQRKKSAEPKPVLAKINSKIKKKIGQLIGSSKDEMDRYQGNLI